LRIDSAVVKQTEEIATVDIFQIFIFIPSPEEEREHAAQENFDEQVVHEIHFR